MESHTKGPWSVFICDDGGEWTGWPLSITADNVANKNGDNRLIVRTGGHWPYRWDNGTSIDEANANARLMAASPDLLSAAKLALYEMRHTIAPRNSFTDAVDALDAAITKAEQQ